METGIHQLTAGYALDALDPDERSAYEAHLADCAHCQQELESFWETTEALAVAASGPEPSPALRDRILADVRAEPPQNVVPFEPRRRRVVPVLAAAAAIAAVVALAVGLWASSVSSDLDETRAALERAACGAAILADPDAQTVALAGGHRPARRRGRTGRPCSCSGLDPAPAGKTYEMWIVRRGQTRIAPGSSRGATGARSSSVDGRSMTATSSP